jgi:hypothetical protein
MAILVALTRSNDNLTPGEINVLDPEAATLHQSQASTIKQHCHQPWSTAQISENGPHFVSCQDDRQSSGPFGTNDALYQTYPCFQNFLIQEQEGVQRLILSRGAYMRVGCQARKELTNLGFGHLRGVVLVVKDNKPFDPPDICFLRPGAIVPRTNGLPYPIEQSRLLGTCGGRDRKRWCVVRYQCSRTRHTFGFTVNRHNENIGKCDTFFNGRASRRIRRSFAARSGSKAGKSQEATA